MRVCSYSTELFDTDWLEVRLKPMQNIGKVFVNASIYKAITHFW